MKVCDSWNYRFGCFTRWDNVIVQAWLRQFVWDEAGYKQAKLDRSAGHEKRVADQLDKEPMFCFETAVSLESIWKSHSWGLQSITGFFGLMSWSYWVRSMQLVGIHL